MKCRVCGKPEGETAMVFKNEPYCSDDHRKVIAGEKVPTQAEQESMDAALFEQLANSGAMG